MSDSIAALHRKITSAQDLQGVVRTMKAMAASNIGQYEQSVLALADYDHTVKLGLGLCFRNMAAKVLIPVPELPQQPANVPQTEAVLGAIVFGSDQGLVGRFNDVIAEHAIQVLAALPGTPKIWAVGERVHMRLADAGLTVIGSYPLPNTVETIAPFVSQMQMDSEEHRAANGYQPLYVFHNRPQSGSQYAPSHQQLLPLDAAWKKSLEATRPWPNKVVPQVMGSSTTALRALLSEHLFISLFRACAESLASENASRLSAMDRADKNIQELLVTLNNTLHTQRQRAIDEELFDVISGYEALSSAAVNFD